MAHRGESDGNASSTAGGLADRFGRRGPLLIGLALMAAGAAVALAASLPLIMLVTVGFSTAHSVASDWVGRLAGSAMGHTASLCLLFYYVGSSVLGSAGGRFWEHGRWPAVAALALAPGGLAPAVRVGDAR